MSKKSNDKFVLFNTNAGRAIGFTTNISCLRVFIVSSPPISKIYIYKYGMRIPYFIIDTFFLCNDLTLESREEISLKFLINPPPMSL
ncbi:hypothetical protein BpHYR1_002879 [Brachionus plicatilis]|uniref:Uncharacterized protein n=1 Tax=Brachionus plicatilis TaxID=10195 RepID=A0A3M7P8G8_BRAPC|nr:hypothetical protein BpHYR1_002879 [Brachionus plicatilis]